MAERRYNFNINKLYAHVYFDISGPGVMGIAVYALPKIPGFSGKPSELLNKYMPGFKNANELFLTMMEQEGVRFNPGILHSGKVFLYPELGSEVQSKLSKFQAAGALQAEDKSAQVVVNLDSPELWARVGNKKFASEEEKMAHGGQIKQQVVDTSLEQPLREYVDALKEYLQDKSNLQLRERYEEKYDHLENVMTKLYIAVSGITNPKYRTKSYSGKSQPPTILFSDKYKVAYYPGYRGAQYLTQKINPKSQQFYAHPQEAAEGKLWFDILIQNVDEIVEKPLFTINTSSLDYITELCAREFFKDLKKSEELAFSDFQRSGEICKQKGLELLEGLKDEKSSPLKTSSKTIDSWIDLETGELYKSLGELLSAISGEIAPPGRKQEQPQNNQKEIQLAAEYRSK